MDDVAASLPQPMASASASASMAAGTSPVPAPAPAKKSTTLSVDRAAFLLLRVKKAFKRKRQQRKDKQAQLAGAAALASAHQRSCRKAPPPLLRSRTLPAIIVPGIPIISRHTDLGTTFQLERTSTKPCTHHRWSLLTRHAPSPSVVTSSANPTANANAAAAIATANNNSSSYNNMNSGICSKSAKSLNLPQDDTALVYRRKSSGSTPHSVQRARHNNNAGSVSTAAAVLQQREQDQLLLQQTDAAYMQTTCDDLEWHADGSVFLRIPAPHVVAARAYRLAATKRNTTARPANATGADLPPEADIVSSTSSTTSSSTALTRLAKLLHQSNSSATSAAKTQLHSQPLLPSAADSYSFPAPGTGGTEDAPRRLSWERRKDSSALQRSASIDSFAEIVWCDTSPRPSLDIPRPAMVPFSKRPSASSLFSNCSATSQTTAASTAAASAQLNINYGDPGGSNSSAGNSRRESLLSPSSTRRNKVTRIINANVLPPTQSKHSKSQQQQQTSTQPPQRAPAKNFSPKVADDGDDDDAAVASDCSSDSVVILRRSPQDDLSVNASLTGGRAYRPNHEAAKSHVPRLCYYQPQPQQQQHLVNGGVGGVFRWSEQPQLSQNVSSLAKIRTAIAYSSARNLKEMEFLLAPPPPPPPTTVAAPPPPPTVAKSRHQVQASKTSSSSSGHHHLSSSSTSSSLSSSSSASSVTSGGRGGVLSVSRHSLANMSNPKNAKLNADENAHMAPPLVTAVVGGSQRQPLAIHRQSTSVSLGGGGRLKGVVVGSSGTPHRNKMSKKQLKLAQAQLDKLTQINLHLHALFSAVEHGHLDKARTILESTDVDVNSINTDGLSPLDVAVLSNNRSMTKMLLQHGALEGSQFSLDSIGSKLNGLLRDAESRIHDLSGGADGGSGAGVGGAAAPCQPTFTSRPSISSIIIGNTGSSVTGCTGNEVDKQIGIWERRVKGLRRLLLGWDQARPPDAPASVSVDVTGESSTAVQIVEPFDGAIGTKFKVQWSTRADFSNVVGEREIMNWTSFHGAMGAQCHVSGLTQGRRYFIRASCGNVKGWGPYKASVPGSIIPSSWRDLNNSEDRYLGRQRVLDNLFTAVRLARPADVSELTLEASAAHRRNPKKKTTIKQLFSVASKFQKHLRRGIYLASIVYCEDKVLVTSEDFLPVIEIDETYPGTLHSDYHWLMKVACTWDDVKSLRTDMERNLTSAVHFRTKLLAAVCQMQSALGLNDLGQLYYKPLRDAHGTVVLSCIQAAKSQKSVSILNSRWLPVNKLQKKLQVALLDDYSVNEMLIASVGEQLQYHQTSSERLGAGLYLGYLKMQCSVEQIQVVVPVRTPNVLPHHKVRDNSHITAEEWQILKRTGCAGAGSGAGAGADRDGAFKLLPLEFDANAEASTEVQRLFLYDLTTAAHKLFAYMHIKPADALTHRLYDVEVIELSKDISFLVLVPSVELTCAAPGQQSELLLQRDDLASLSIQAFEMIHLRTYQPGIIQKYARLSCILELDTALANHSHREAFSTSELQTAKERLAKLQELTASLNAVWKSVRWLMDVIAFARDKNAQPSRAMREILDFGQGVIEGGGGFGTTVSTCIAASGAASTNIASDDNGNNQQQQLLQLPARASKTNCGRGSWPGPAGMAQPSGGGDGGSATHLVAEHSKSEQNLGHHRATTPSSTAAPTQQQRPPPTSAAQTTHKFLQVGGGNHSNEPATLTLTTHSGDFSPRKNSGDSVSSQYTTRSFYSGGDSSSTVGSSNELGGSHFAIPPSRSDDTLASTEALRRQHHHSAAAASTFATSSSSTIAASSHRKRTSSNIAQAMTPNSGDAAAGVVSSCSSSLASAHISSSSAPYLACDVAAAAAAVSSHSLRSAATAAQAASSSSGAIVGGKTKAASSGNLQDGKLYVKTTLLATKMELKAPHSSSATPSEATCSSRGSSTKSLSRQSSEEDSASGSTHTEREQQQLSQQSSGIIQVYTAYNTGLASGTSLKLHVTPKTSAREVINLVVKQLNMAAVLKGNNGPIYPADKLDSFCLVAVIGARERCLRDDFKPLQLQNPWKKGRLYVRQKHELLAAIEHSNRKSHLI